MRTLARLTGLSEEYVERTDLRIEHWRFCTELLRDRGLTVGRIDGRFSGPLHSLIAENMDADPSMDAMEAPFTAALHHYLRSELGSTQDLSYEIFASAIKEWSFKEFEGKPIFVADKLERVMRANPHLRGADRVRLLRPGDALPRGGGHGRPPAAARRRPSTGSSTRTSRPATCPTCTRRPASARPPASQPSSRAALTVVRRAPREPMTAPPGAVSVFTDGACSGNPGPGGWAWAVDRTTYASGGDRVSTNQRMEIRAALEAVRTLTGRCWWSATRRTS